MNDNTSPGPEGAGRMLICTTCHGSGQRPRGFSPDPSRSGCRDCKGKGKFYVQTPQALQELSAQEVWNLALVGQKLLRSSKENASAFSDASAPALAGALSSSKKAKTHAQ